MKYTSWIWLVVVGMGATSLFALEETMVLEVMGEGSGGRQATIEQVEQQARHNAMRTALEQAEQRTEEMQARVDAIDRLVEMGVLDTSGGPATGSSDNWSLDPEQSRAVDDRLNAIKRELETG